MTTALADSEVVPVSEGSQRGWKTDAMRFVIEAGDIDRHSPLIKVSVPTSFEVPGNGIVAVRDEQSGQVLAAQFDREAGELVLVVPGELGSGSTRTLTVVDEPVTPAHPTDAAVKLDRAVLRVGGEKFADYLTGGGRRPYFWPVISSTGASVVRGQGSGDHPHHTGLAVSYGGHSEDGSTNIWSDWDEPPYGPGGRMLHRGFRRVQTGPVYGELVQDLTYINVDGDPIADEVRTIRWWWADDDARFLDISCSVTHVRDAGRGPFLLMVRTPQTMGIPNPGRMTNAADAPAPEMVYAVEDRYRAAWTDASGPSGGPPPVAPAGPPEDLPDLRADAKQYASLGEGPWHGIALLDHPGNDGFPNVVGKYAMVQQITQAHYPPAESPEGPFSFGSRLLVHAGDAEQGRVADAAADYAAPCVVRVD